MGHESKFTKTMSFTSKRDGLLEFQSKLTIKVEKQSNFDKTLQFQSRWITEEVT